MLRHVSVVVAGGFALLSQHPARMQAGTGGGGGAGGAGGAGGGGGGGAGGEARCAPWNDNWDFRSSEEKTNVVRHIVLVRHGQYDEKGKGDAAKVLTELGREQARLTGKRLAGYLPAGVQWKAVYQSDMARAKETAKIVMTEINASMPAVALQDPIALLDEGYPAEPVPAPSTRLWAERKTWEHAPRIEAAFRMFFHRENAPKVKSGGQTGAGNASPPSGPADPAAFKDEAKKPPASEHTYELVVGHGNVIRFFVCRALQFSPEAWLRIAVYNCSITHIVIGSTGRVSLYTLGDVGHLDPRSQLTYGSSYTYSMKKLA